MESICHDGKETREEGGGFTVHTRGHTGQPRGQDGRGLLRLKRAEGVALALPPLESLGATTADYGAVFTESVIRSILGEWVAESSASVAKALAPHGAVSDLLQKLAEQKYRKRLGQTTRLKDFGGFAHAHAAAVTTARFVGVTIPARRPAAARLITIPTTRGRFRTAADSVWLPNVEPSKASLSLRSATRPFLRNGYSCDKPSSVEPPRQLWVSCSRGVPHVIRAVELAIEVSNAYPPAPTAQRRPQRKAT